LARIIHNCSSSFRSTAPSTSWETRHVAKQF
jgi:hypothetical protein